MARSVRKLADTDVQERDILDEGRKRRKLDTLVPDQPVPGSAESRQVYLLVVNSTLTGALCLICATTSAITIRQKWNTTLLLQGCSRFAGSHGPQFWGHFRNRKYCDSASGGTSSYQHTARVAAGTSSRGGRHAGRNVSCCENAWLTSLKSDGLAGHFCMLCLSAGRILLANLTAFVF